MNRGRGGGSASAQTMTIWSALATMTRSTGSVSSAERRSAVVRGRHPDDPGERAGRARGVPGQRDPVADDHAAAAQFPGRHRGDHAVADQHAVPAPVDRGDEALDRVLVRGPAPGARAGAPPRPHPDVVLVQVLPRARSQGTCSSIEAHNRVNPGKVFATVAAFSTSIPGTARPSTAAAMTIR